MDFSLGAAFGGAPGALRAPGKGENHILWFSKTIKYGFPQPADHKIWLPRISELSVSPDILAPEIPPHSGVAAMVVLVPVQTKAKAGTIAPMVPRTLKQLAPVVLS